MSHKDSFSITENTSKSIVILVFPDRRITEIPSDITELENLRALFLSRVTVEQLPPEIGQLKTLRKIHLLECNLTHIPEFIFQIENLEVLHLDKNKISYISPEIKNLKNLRVLTLSRNELKELPSNIGQLQKLRYLDLGHNKLTSLPKETRYLHSLKKLNLTHNKLSKFPRIIGQLKNLRALKINNGRFFELPNNFGALQKLKTLDLRSGNLQTITPVIAKIKTLESLLLSNNNLTDIPIELNELGQLKRLRLRRNSLPIPPEISGKTDHPKTILDYYYKSVGGKKYPLNEVKILFVGQGSIGKTSLVNRITNNTFSHDQSKTEGIAIKQWKVDDLRSSSNRDINRDHDQSENQKSEITVNIWDFGGQEIMHATHQFFLTKRSLYILVLDSRLTQEENRVEYWLKIIRSYSKSSPIVIVGNKVDQHPLDIDHKGLLKKYPNIVNILETSAATGIGINELKETIVKKVNRLKYVRDLVPATWFKVKAQLENLGYEQNFITHDKYLDLCAENEVSDETSQRTLIGFLHDLGVVLHFQDDPRLEALGILNPQWVTNGVYKILNSHELFQNKGVLTLAMLNSILNIDGYPRDKRLFIVDMMKKFELCYDIEPDKTFLVPDLLPKDEPAELKFNGIPAFEYAYPVLPSSVITRFIVRMNQKIENHFVWRTGVVLKIGDNTALVKADIEDRKITIAIDGQEHTRRDALSAIRYQLDEIHGSIKGLDAQKRVPIPEAPNAEPLDYDYLLQLEQDGFEEHPVKNGNRLVKVNVKKLLSGVMSETERRQATGSTTNYYIAGDVNASGDFIGRDKSISAGDHSIVIGGNVSDSRISANYNKINSAEIAPELKETMKQLAEAVDAMIQKLPAEQATKVAEDFGKLADEAVKPKPNQKWYSVSIEGLIKAAENLDKLGTPVISLSRKVLSLLTSGANKQAR